MNSPLSPDSFVSPSNSPHQVSLQLLTVPATQGWFWLRRGAELFYCKPIDWALWIVTMGIFFILASLIAPIGWLVFVATLPTLTALTFYAAQKVDQLGKQALITPLILLRLLTIRPLRQNLFKLGLIYLGVFVLISTIAVLPFVTELRPLLDSKTPLSEDSLIYLITRPGLVFITLYLPIAAAFWYAPALVMWHEMSLRKALFFSMVACWRNKAAFTVYSLAWAGLSAALWLASYLLQLGLGLEDRWMSIISSPFELALSSVTYASLYATYNVFVEVQKDSDSDDAEPLPLAQQEE